MCESDTAKFNKLGHLSWNYPIQDIPINHNFNLNDLFLISNEDENPNIKIQSIIIFK